MANYTLSSQFNTGKFKGKKVIDVIATNEGINYVNWLHNSNYNVKFKADVFAEIKAKLNEKFSTDERQ